MPVYGFFFVFFMKNRKKNMLFVNWKQKFCCNNMEKFLTDYFVRVIYTHLRAETLWHPLSHPYIVREAILLNLNWLLITEVILTIFLHCTVKDKMYCSYVLSAPSDPRPSIVTPILRPLSCYYSMSNLP